MPELRKDLVTGRWVIISTDRQKRPNDFRLERSASVGREQCPFCPGHEAMTPPEVLSYRQNGGAPNAPGWDVRVVPNKYPALRVEGNLDREGEGLFDRMNGIGAHEVIIETPHHDQTLATLPEGAIEKVLWAWRERVLDLQRHFGLVGADVDKVLTSTDKIISHGRRIENVEVGASGGDPAGANGANGDGRLGV